MLEKLRANQVDTTKHGLTYLEMKNTLLLSYCQFLSLFILLKLEGQSVADHPVIERLLYIKTLLERLRPLDQKLQYQVDKLLRTAALAESGALQTQGEQDDGMLYKANIENMQNDENDENNGSDDDQAQEDESEIEDDYDQESDTSDKKKGKPKKPEVFKAAKMNPVMYEDKDTKRQRRQELFSKKNALRSDYVNELRREVYDLPEEVHLGGMTS